MGIHLPPELFQAYLAKLQHDNTPENFEHFKQNSPIALKIKTQKGTTQERVLNAITSPMEELTHEKKRVE